MNVSLSLLKIFDLLTLPSCLNTDLLIRPDQYEWGLLI